MKSARPVCAPPLTKLHSFILAKKNSNYIRSTGVLKINLFLSLFFELCLENLCEMNRLARVLHSLLGLFTILKAAIKRYWHRAKQLSFFSSIFKSHNTFDNKKFQTQTNPGNFVLHAIEISFYLMWTYFLQSEYKSDNILSLFAPIITDKYMPMQIFNIFMSISSQVEEYRKADWNKS